MLPPIIQSKKASSTDALPEKETPLGPEAKGRLRALPPFIQPRLTARALKVFQSEDLNALTGVKRVRLISDSPGPCQHKTIFANFRLLFLSTNSSL
ncbi:hypothetical protein BTI56_04040 [Lactobacillus delbrueckii subsp. bulgaricus]|nr:hypothetical protein [Lactobacillus delbrueckii subsp. bulgaricus]